tara:strand:- start:678 stop:923 length:246 start_codon:yes stop_codon:yes gene_type:complete
MINKLILFFCFLVVAVISCNKTYKKIDETKPECEQILDIVTDCMGLHRGAFDYINDCGSASLDVIKQLETCDRILDYIENE